MVVEEEDGFGLSLFQESFSQKLEVVHGLIVFSEFEKGSNGNLVFFFLDVNADVNLILDNVLDEVSDLLFSFLHDFEILFLDISSEEV